MPKRNSKKLAKRPSARPLPSFYPSTIATKPVFQRVMRWEVQSTALTSITVYSMFMSMGVTTSTAIVRGLIDSFRIKRLTIWNINAAATTTVNVLDKLKVLVIGPFGNAKEFVAYGNPDHPAHLSLKAGRDVPDSAVWWWYNTSGSQPAAPLFKITASQGSILDIEFEFCLCDLNVNTMTQSSTTYTANQFVLVSPDYLDVGGVTGTQNLTAPDGNSIGDATISSTTLSTPN